MEDRVKFSYGVTINMGDYQSARIDIGLEQDVPPYKTIESKLAEMQEYVIREVKKLAIETKKAGMK